MLKKHSNSVLGHLGVYYDAAGTPSFRTRTVVKESDTLETENHPGWNRKNPNKLDNGGPFRVVKDHVLHYASGDFAVSFLDTLAPKTGYKGCVVEGTEPTMPTGDSIDVNLNQWAPIAYSRMKPTKPSFDGVTELLELRDMTSLLRVKASEFTKGIPKAGPRPSDWLALNFGWLPILRSMQNLYQAYYGWEKRLKWLIEHEGRPIRSRVHLETFSSQSEPVETTGPATSVTFTPVLHSNAYIGNYTKRTWSATTRTVWASAQFRFWLPPGVRDVEWTYAMKRKLFGVNFSPSQVFAAFPWSWLIGWFFNAATVLKNLEAEVADRLAADYFYMMGTQSRVNVSELTCRTKSSNWGPSKVVSARTEHIVIEKRRMKGDPFGWNTNPNSLSGFQLSILGALGLSRLS